MMDISDKIKNIKNELGDELIILTHHYQRKEVVDLGDYLGDSFALSKKAAEDKKARFIVFCGVHFMAESAAILAQPHQTVQIPNIHAGCWMADMIDAYQVEKAWEELANFSDAKNIMPIVYVNSDAEIKAFCGKNGGTTCTSSNAPAAFNWALGQREKIFFFPDQHLGRNTANQMGIHPEEILVWNPGKTLGGNSLERIKKAKIILWDGHCLVHTRFSVDHIKKMKQKYPGAKTVVHPECTQEVVEMADAVGSTSFIVKYVEESPPNSEIIIGTEVNLVKRLALEHPDKTIVTLHDSLCPNMAKINLSNLFFTLENIGEVNVVTVSEKIKNDAKSALNRMLSLAK